MPARCTVWTNAERHLQAGAHGLFIESPPSVEEMAVIARSFDVPQLVNPLEGGRSPILSPAEYGELGFRMIGCGITLLLRAAKAMQIAIEDIRTRRFERKGHRRELRGVQGRRRFWRMGADRRNLSRAARHLRDRLVLFDLKLTAQACRSLNAPLAGALKLGAASRCRRPHAFAEIRRPALPFLLDAVAFGRGLRPGAAVSGSDRSQDQSPSG
jgi:hypothetical protein